MRGWNLRFANATDAPLTGGVFFLLQDQLVFGYFIMRAGRGQFREVSGARGRDGSPPKKFISIGK